MIKRFKLVAVALTAFGLVSSANADGMEVTGKARMRAEQKATADLGQMDIATTAVEVNMKWNPDPKVSVFFQPKFVKVFGLASGASGTSTAGICTSTNNSGGLCDQSGSVHQAYTTVSPTDKISYTFGRYEMKYGDEVVIGPVGWSMVGRAFDGFKAHWVASDMIWLDVFYNKLTESNTIDNKDHTFYGLYLGGKLSGAISEADLYYLVNDNRTGQTDPATTAMNTTGVRVKGATGPVDYRVEYGTQGGKNLTTSITDADNTDAEVGFKFGDNRAYVGMISAGKNYSQLYTTGHKFLGYADIIGRKNVSALHVGATGKFMDHMSAQVDYWSFDRVDTATGMIDKTGTAVGTTTGTSKAVGSEIDLVLKCNQIKALTWEAGYSIFTGGDWWKASVTGASTNEKVTFGYVMATATF